MRLWPDISDGRIAPGALPATDLAVALRERDICNATKQIPMPYSPSGVATKNFTWVDLGGGWKIWIPSDLPDNFVLAWPVKFKMQNPTIMTGWVRLHLGANYSSAAATSSTTDQTTVLTVAVETSLRGTLATLYPQCQVPENEDLAPIDQIGVSVSLADAAYHGLASLRRAA